MNKKAKKLKQYILENSNINAFDINEIELEFNPTLFSFVIQNDEQDIRSVIVVDDTPQVIIRTYFVKLTESQVDEDFLVLLNQINVENRFFKLMFDDHFSLVADVVYSSSENNFDSYMVMSLLDIVLNSSPKIYRMIFGYLNK